MDLLDASFWNVDRIVSAISLIITAASLGYALYTHRAAQRTAYKRRSYDWNDVVLGSKRLAALVQKEFVPEVIYAPNANGGIVALLVRDAIDPKIPVITGSTLARAHVSRKPNWPGYHVCTTSKWFLMVPEALKSYSRKSILVVDDYIQSGDSVVEFKKCLIGAYRFRSRLIKSAVLVANETAFKTKKQPNYWWERKLEPDFMFPWGPAR